MDNLCNNCIHKDVCGRYAATWGMKTCENFMEMPKGCDMCRGRSYTDKPFKVITQRGAEVEVPFHFCPVCGTDMRGKEDGKEA